MLFTELIELFIKRGSSPMEVAMPDGKAQRPEEDYKHIPNTNRVIIVTLVGEPTLTRERVEVAPGVYCKTWHDSINNMTRLSFSK